MKREVDQADGMARNHQTTTTHVDFAYLPTEPLHEDKITNNNILAARSRQGSNLGLSFHSYSSYTLVNKLSC